MTEAPQRKIVENEPHSITIKVIKALPVKLIFLTQVHESFDILWSNVNCSCVIILTKAVSFEHEMVKDLKNVLSIFMK